MKRIFLFSLLLVATVAPAQFDAIRTLTPTNGQEVLRPVEAQIFSAPQAEYPALETKLLEVFKSPETTLEGKQYTCRMLRFCASEACVPVLAPKLADPELSSFVRLVFQGLETPAVDKALIAALSRANDTIRIGIIGTLGQRSESPKSVKAIRKYLKSRNPEVQLAAITALGNIGGKNATKALVKAKVRPEFSNPWKHAQLRCAGTLDAKTAERAYRKFLAEDHDDEIRAAALVGLTTLSPADAATEVLSLLSSDNARLKQTATGLLAILPTEKMIGSLTEMTPENQVLVISTLSDRQAVEAEGAMLQLAVGENEAIRNAAFQALEYIGGVQSIEILVAAAPHDDYAFNSLCGLNADGTDAGIIQALEAPGDNIVRGKMIECLTFRKTRAALPLFIELAEGDWSRNCKAAIDGMAILVFEDDFSAYAELFTATSNEKKLQALEKSIATAAQRLPDADACTRPLINASGQLDGEAKYAVIRALGSIGGDAAHGLLTQAVTNQTPEIKDAAVRGLAGWPTIDVADQLLELSVSSTNETHQVLALRGYIRLAGTLYDFEPVFEMCQKAAAATDRSAELIAVISCVKRFHFPEVLDFLAELLDNPEIFTEAGEAICQLAPHSRLQKLAVPIVERIAETATDENLAKKAHALLTAYHEQAQEQ